MEKVKILFVIPSLSHGGTNRVLEDLLSLLDSSLYDFLVLPLHKNISLNSYYGHNFSKKAQLVLLPIVLGWLTFGRFPFAIHTRVNKYFHFSFVFRWLCRYNAHRIENATFPDVVVAFEEGNPTLFCNSFRCKKIAWVHCDYQLGYAQNMTQSELKKEEQVYRNYDKIVCVSNYTNKSFVKTFQSLKHKVITIYNPTNTERILRMADQGCTANGFGINGYTIVSVGRFSKVKQFDLIPEIIMDIERITDGKLDYQWYIIGDGDRLLMSETRRKITSYGLSGKLFLLGAKDNPYPYIKAADLYVCTSFSEAYPCVINEAKVLNVPVVSNRFPSVVEILDSQCGIVTNFSQISRTIAEVITDIDGIYSNLRRRCCYINNNAETVGKIKALIGGLVKRNAND